MNLSTLLFCLLAIQTLSASAQTPKLQSESIWATNIKIDGNINDWGNPLKGYDKKTKIAYSLANDNKNIYLAITTTKKSKAISGGISFEVNAREISFPYNPGRDLVKYYSDRDVSSKKILKTPDDFKQIELSGFDEINKPIVSIYNEYGIKAAITEDKENTYYIYELAVPLKLFGLDPLCKELIIYAIKLRGIIMPTGPRGKTVVIPGKTARWAREMDEQILDMETPTQFTGKYKLALK